jgi:RNA polymerase sigma factor (sigma-70 family)
MSPDANDFDLLQAYARNRDESAFAELVRRNIHLVYSAALRLLRGDAHAAEDITQAVFADLARKASRIPRSIPVAGWLYRHTHYTASNFLRAEHRRSGREDQAVMNNDASQADAPGWRQIGPVLDEAMQELPESDRSALLLRFFRGQSWNGVGSALGISEDAARKRVDRALDRLRQALVRRGIHSTGSVLASLLAAHVVSFAPASLAAGVCASVLAGTAGSAAGASVSGAAGVFFDLMNASKIKMGVASVAVAAGVAVPVWQQAQLDEARNQLAAVAPQLQELDSLRGAAHGAARTALDLEELQRLREEHVELMRLRGEVGQLRNAVHEQTQIADIYRNRNEELRRKFGTDAETPDGMSRRLQLAGWYWVTDAWTDKGAETPLEALESLLAADRQGNRERLLELVDREEMERRGYQAGHYSVGARERPGRRAKIIGVQVVDWTTSADGQTARIGAILEKEHPWPPGVPQPEGVRHVVHDSVVWHFKRGDDGWRITHRDF